MDQNYYSQIIEITHPFNLNRKLDNLFKPIPELYTGIGIKRTNQYESRLSKEEWIQKREEFWGNKYLKIETRTEGSQKIWQTIKQAANADEEIAKDLLNAGELIFVTDTMQILLDAEGMRYDVPIFCLNEPISFPNQKSTESGLAQNFAISLRHFKVRYSKWNQDRVFEYSTNTNIQTLKEAISAGQNIKKICLFFRGREMQTHHYIGNYGITEDDVLNIIIQVLQVLFCH